MRIANASEEAEERYLKTKTPPDKNLLEIGLCEGYLNANFPNVSKDRSSPTWYEMRYVEFRERIEYKKQARSVYFTPSYVVTAKRHCERSEANGNNQYARE